MDGWILDHEKAEIRVAQGSDPSSGLLAAFW